MFRAIGLCAAILTGLVAISSSAQGAIFTEDFNSGYTPGGINGTQLDTSFAINEAGSLAGWSATSGVHRMLTLSTGNLANMWYDTFVLEMSSGVAANTNGTNYQVDFDYGTAVTGNPAQATQAGDQLHIEVLRADNSTLASLDVTPGAWGVGNRNLEAGNHGLLSYTGDGTGDVRLRISEVGANNDRLNGEIDNISWDVAAVPEPASLSLALLGLAGLGWFGIRRRRK